MKKIYLISILIIAILGFSLYILRDKPMGAVADYCEIHNVGNINTYYCTYPFTGATTTPANILTPTSTTTVQSVCYNIKIGTSTAATIDIATSTTPYATTTVLLANTSVVANAQATYCWKPQVTGDDIVSPNTYFLLKTGGAGLSGYTFTGKLKVILQEVVN